MPRAGRIAAPASASSPEVRPFTHVVSNDGDILIQFKDRAIRPDISYRCSRDALRNASEYFNVLLDPAKFSEGIAIDARLKDLKRRYNDPATIPVSELPKAVLADVGDLPKSSLSVNTAVVLFFNILHNPSETWPILRAKTVNLIALLSIIADRFACSDTIADYLIRQGPRATVLKDRKSAPADQNELGNRQKLLVGLIFGFPEWVYQSSASLIVQGPTQRTTTGLDTSEDEELEGGDALWWRLPGGVEEELACRRDYVLDTLSSVQKHFINLYISRQPQCRLGYSSSPQCDSYQLGEMIRFFSRKGIVRIESVFDPAPEDLEPYNGNLDNIVTKLKECPSYQIDAYHTHCGLRTRLMSVLEGPRSPRPSSQVGLCLECWRKDKSKESWLENPTRGTWTNAGERFCGRGCRDHRDTKAMYTAVKRDWTPVSAV